jgi:hypothetical protein
MLQPRLVMSCVFDIYQINEIKSSKSRGVTSTGDVMTFHVENIIRMRRK